MEKNYHIYYFDYIRFMAMICVIYMHGAANLLSNIFNFDWEYVNLSTSFSFAAVPLFLMMSGYLILSDKKTLDISYLIKERIPRLLLPLIFWTFVAIFGILYQNNEIINLKNFSKYLISSLEQPVMCHFWYVYTLIGIYFISPIVYYVIKKLNKKGHICILIVIFSVLTLNIIKLLVPLKFEQYFLLKLIDNLCIFDGYLLIFILGYYIGNLKKKISNKFLIFLLISLLSFITIGTYVLSFENVQYMGTFQYQNTIFEVLLAASIFLLFKQNCNKKSSFFSQIPVIPFCFSIYFLHNIVFDIMGWVYIYSFFDTIICAILNFIICYLFVKTLSSIKFLCYISTGIKYKKACDSCNWIYTYNKIKNNKCKEG